jgi:hypothetical protein
MSAPLDLLLPAMSTAAVMRSTPGIYGERRVVEPRIVEHHVDERGVDPRARPVTWIRPDRAA